jgi:chemotaxis protein CheX
MPAEKIAEEPSEAHSQITRNWIGQMDQAVAEVLRLMLQHSSIAAGEGSARHGRILAKIVFSGTLEGACVVRVSATAAGRLTGALLGSEGDWDDQMVDDAVGELCNMIAGVWKSGVGAAGSMCSLSIPSVSRSHFLEELHQGHKAMRRFYTFDGIDIEVELALSEVALGLQYANKVNQQPESLSAQTTST